MGQELSQHELYVKQLKDALKTLGVKVKTMDLFHYFDFVKKICPWFPQEGLIDIKRWKRVGSALEDYYKVFGPDKILVTAFSYWNLIKELVDRKEAPTEGAIKQAEDLLQNSTCPKASKVPAEEVDLISLDSNEEDSARQSKTHSESSDLDYNKSDPNPKNGSDNALLQPDAAPMAPSEALPLPPPYAIPSTLTALEAFPVFPPIEHLKAEIDHALLQPDAAPMAPSEALPLPPPYAIPSTLTALEAFPVFPPIEHLKAEIDRLQQCARALSRALVAELQSLTVQDLFSGPVTTTTETPIVSRSCGLSTTAPSALKDFPVLEIIKGGGDDDEPIRQHNPFKLSDLKELKAAVSQYGAMAPYTITLLEGLAEQWLTPSDWHTLAKALLHGGDFLLWRSEYFDACKETAKKNIKTINDDWTFDMLMGEGEYDSNDTQMNYPPGLFAQIQTAAIKAWKKLPAKGDSGVSLTSIKQGPDEPFADFVHLLSTAATRLFGSIKGGIELILKQLAFENAIPTCQAAIRPHKKKTNLDGYMRLCTEIGSSYQQGLAMAAALSKTVKDFLNDRKWPITRGCFKCGKPGHFSRDCKSPPGQKKKQ
ncbi:endogenous retrovirus group K member 5 Gag polyprotein-like [Nannospalax galili]|uniref:endogenous retrovirus group K member 5 Gag polyprotein-like n=1 Tax=Nannospalax galili TaxID=1026970 RepID=UPI000819FD15|nr:endogenous retrovirus group K member 5 Gag polyprotein-like [Nannospalax galili]